MFMQQPLFDPALAETVSAAGVVAVLVIDDAKDAVPLARALLGGGVGVMELTLRTPAAIDALSAIRRDVPEMIAGIGTILTVEQMQAAQSAGAAFGVSPGCNPRLLAAAREEGILLRSGHRHAERHRSGARARLRICSSFFLPSSSAVCLTCAPWRHLTRISVCVTSRLAD